MTIIHPSSPIVVKLGGGLSGRPEFDQLLDRALRARAIVAPGGGPFADAVRASQPILGFSDAAAHRMAILAMDQMAEAILSRAPGFAPCSTRSDFAAARAAGRAALWMPSRMAREADVPASWDVTSDSLALWLARTLGAPALVIVKAARATGSSPAEWAAAGLVDPHLPVMARGYEGRIALISDASAAALESALASPDALRETAA